MLAGGIKRVVVGMSGGVDSTVSALLLKRKGFEVVGVFMRNWDGLDETGVCTADKDCEAAERVAKKLDIPFQQVDFVKEYWNEVFEDFLSDYSAGLTPNPDVLCNSRIKFNHFYRHAMEVIGCDAIATGHYARNSFGEFLEYRDQARQKGEPARLLKSVDRSKDQTFFLSQIPQKALQDTIFPVGEFTKPIVKKIAAQADFAEIAAKKESMGICFVGKKRAPGRRGFQEFISNYIPAKEGNFVDVDTGHVVGTHEGVHQWTIGQRVKLKINNMAKFVVSKNAAKNEILVASDIDHPSLFSENFFTLVPHWITGASPNQLSSRSHEKALTCEYRSQNVAPLTKCQISYTMSYTDNWEYVDKNSLTVSLVEPARAITPGQFAAFYLGEECLGSARIHRPGPSLYTLNVGNCRTKIREKLGQESGTK